MTRKLLITLAVHFIFITSYSQTIADLNFLTGTWKVEGKETYEHWEMIDNQLKGSSYTIENGEKLISETLSIKMLNGKVVYEATVLNQNEGKTIPFTLTKNTTNGFSFENPKHDFPTKIIYQRISTTELVVQVLGADDKGFTINFSKQ